MQITDMHHTAMLILNGCVPNTGPKMQITWNSYILGIGRVKQQHELDCSLYNTGMLVGHV